MEIATSTIEEDGEMKRWLTLSDQPASGGTDCERGDQ